MSRTSRALCGSRPDVGSSSSTTGGLWSSVRASATRCFSPFDSSTAMLSARSARPKRSSALFTVAAGSFTWCSRAYVSRFVRTLSRSQSPGALGEKPHVLPDAVDRAAGERHAGHRCFTVGRRDQPRKHPQRCRLAGTVGAKQAEDLACPHVKRDVFDGGAIAKAARQVAGGNHRAPRIAAAPPNPTDAPTSPATTGGTPATPCPPLAR